MNRSTQTAEFRSRLRVARTSVASADGDNNNPAEEQIVAWLAKLRLLHGVPVHYLVPDQRMLPIESIRFFQVNESWIVSLIDGAFSIGRSVTGSDPAEKEHLNRIHAKAVKKTSQIRARNFGLQAADGSGVMSGFLLRSAVVSGWPNMEIEATDAGGTVLTGLRQERLSSDIMFGIFDGLIKTVKFREPAETLHFGIEQGHGTRTKQLKYVDEGPGGQQPGSIIDGVAVEVKLRDPAADNNVLDIDELSDLIEKTLVANHGISKTTYTPAAFALEMIQGVQEVDYKIHNL